MVANTLPNNNFETKNYIELDKKIPKWYFNKESKIEIKN